MKENKPRGIIFILISGILNCILGVAHQVVLYFTYKDYSALITPQAEQVLADFLLFSIGTGITLLFVGLFMIYCYIVIKRGERWAYVIGIGASLLLLSFAAAIWVIMGIDQPIGYIHLLNSLLIGVPLIINRKAFA